LSNISKYIISSIQKRKGLTLVELAIVVALLGVIFTGIFSTYYAAIKISRGSSPKHGTSRQSIFYALENIRSTFSQAYYIEGHKRLIFVGKQEGVQGQRLDRVVFAAVHPNAEETGTPAVREVGFFVKPMSQNSEYYYLLRREDEMVDANPTTGGIDHVLLDHVVSFQLKYSHRGDKWLDDWNTLDTKKIPRLIRIEIVALVGDTEMKYESLAYPGLYYK
jgi:general secretion pathway protein J